MSTYRKIHGRSIQAVTTDPSESVAEGQVWYNTSSDTFKSVVGLEAWRSGAPYPRSADHTAGSGTQTAALSCSDTIPHPSADITSTFEYNGSGWSAGGSMNTGRGDGFNNMTGSQTASFYVAGRPNAGPPTPFGSTATEEYDGSSWTAGGAYPAGLRAANAFGTLTAGVNAGGNSSSPSVSSNVNNEYNGTSWTSGNNNTLGRFNASSSGTSTAGILVAGFSNPPPVVNSVTEEYDGSSWTSGGSLPEGRNGLGGSGTQTANIVFGGSSPPGTKQTTTSKYDGTSWTTSPATLATAIEKFGSAKGGSQTATLAWCGVTTTDATEEYDSSANVITAAAWSSSTAINTARNSFGGFGLQTANIIAGGYGSPNVKNETEEWDGTSWSEKNNLNTARSHYGGSQASPYTAVVIFKGNTSSTDNSTNATEEWDGTNWTTVTANPTTGQRNMGAGTQTAALSFGGIQNPAPPAPRVATSQEYDGTNWTSGGTMNTARNDGGGTGTQTAGLGYGGDTPGATAATEEYNGTAWTSVNNMVVASGYYGECGQSQTDAMAVGNLYANPDNGCQHYDGTNWSTRPLLGTARFDSAGSGTGTAAMVAGGATPGNTDAVEEFNGETTTLNVKTLTQS